MHTLSIQIGLSPLHYASLCGHTDVVKLLIEYDAQIDVSAEVQVLVSLSCNMSHVHDSLMQDEEGSCITALFLACQNGHKAVVELLIQKGANINYQDKVR